MYAKKERLLPDRPLPAEKINLKALPTNRDLVIWLGHSSWYVQLGGKRILIDPVLSSSAAPFSFMNKAFAGTSPYTAEDMPAIDCLLISHDHYDHLDYATLLALTDKVEKVICPLGVGASLKQWGYGPAQIQEGIGRSNFRLGEVFECISCLPAITPVG